MYSVNRSCLNVGVDRSNVTARCVGFLSFNVFKKMLRNPNIARTSSPVDRTFRGSRMACHARWTSACPSMIMSSGFRFNMG